MKLTQNVEFLIKEKPEYYSCKICDSYDCFVNISIGGRGVGKTTNRLNQKIKKSIKERVIDCVKTGQQFILLRRYKTETAKTKDLLSKYIKGGKITTKGLGNSCFKFLVNGVVIGYSIALSIATTFKSVDFDYVTSIIYDEAILKPRGNYKYLKDEVNCLLEFASTVFRDRTNAKIYILGNNLDLFNPYFAYWNIPSFDNIYVDKQRSIFIEMIPDNKKHMEKAEKSPMYKLTIGTSYGDYHYNNALLTNGEYISSEKPKSADLYFRIIVNDITLNIYFCNGGVLYVEYREKIIDDEIAYTFMCDNKPSYYNVKYFKSLGMCKYLIKSFYDKTILYSEEKSGYILSTIIELLI